MGFFDKLKKITSNLFSGFTEADEDFFEELEETLIMADLGVDAATDAVEKLRTKVRKEHLQSQEAVREGLREILMAEMEVGDTAMKLDTKPSVCIFIGVNGVGKTTSIGKIAASLKKQGKRVLLCAADTFRAAAADQLEIWAERAGCEIVRQYEGADPGAVLFDALQAAKARNVDVVLCDTAGRLHNKANLMAELAKLSKIIDRECPGCDRETLLVLDATTGQNGLIQARTFKETAGLTGIVLTKLDGDARGGAALSMRSVTGKPIKFSGEGEKLDQFGPFVPGRMADRILGMGDIVGLVEHAAARIDEEQAAKSMDRMMSGKFDFNDFLDQMKMMQSLGPLEGLLGLLPGFGKIKKQLPEGALDPRRMKHMEAIVLSMTAKERSNPNLLNPSRRRRIAAGCGRPLMEVNKLIKNFSEMRKMMSGKGKMGAMMKQMASMKGKGGKVPGFPGMGGGLGGLKGLGGLGGGLGGLFGGRR